MNVKVINYYCQSVCKIKFYNFVAIFFTWYTCFVNKLLYLDIISSKPQTSNNATLVLRTDCFPNAVLCFLILSSSLFYLKTPTSLILPAMLKNTIDWCRITITHAARPDSYKHFMQRTCILCSQYQSCFLLPFTWPILRLLTFRCPHRSTVTLACINLRDRWTTWKTTSDRKVCVGEKPVNLPPS